MEYLYIWATEWLLQPWWILFIIEPINFQTAEPERARPLNRVALYNVSKELFELNAVGLLTALFLV